MVNNLIILWGLNKTFNFINLIISLVTLSLLIFLSRRIGGRVSKAPKFLMVAMSFFVIESIIIICDLFSIIVLEFIVSITTFLMVLFILLAILTLRSTVNEIDRNHDNLKRKLKKKA